MANNRRVLVIAGSDCSGGAGLEADQKVIAAFGCYAMTATTALTVQDTQGVYDTHEIPPGFVKRQIETCINDIGVDVVKTGMLASAETILEVAKALDTHGRPVTVIDPVVVSTSGSQLLPQTAVKELREHLLPLATILTPNVPEARLLLENATGVTTPEPENLDDLIELTKGIHGLGVKWVLLKGGHLPLTKDYVACNGEKHGEPPLTIDVLYNGKEAKFIKTDYVRSTSTHGTGCSLAAAIACGLALGHDVPKAVKMACWYVEEGIKTAIPRGRGTGPINHFHTIPIEPPAGYEYEVQ